MKIVATAAKLVVIIVIGWWIVSGLRSCNLNATSKAVQPAAWPTPMINLLAVQERKTGIADAAAFDITQRRAHHTLLLHADGEVPGEQLPYEWRAKAISDTELVAIYDIVENKIDSKHYTCTGPCDNDGIVTRYRVDTHIELREARTWKLLAQGILEGAIPEYPYETYKSELMGAMVPFEKVYYWIAQQAIPSATPPATPGK